MARGDQIYVMRELMGIPGVYEHHGIDVGDGTVIHYRKTEEAMIARTTMATFAQGQPVYIKQQPVAFIATDVLSRAESRLGERKYDLFYNNCEHFATWCKTGRSESAQLANFGFRLDRLNLPEVRQLIEKTSRDRTPEQAIALFTKAMGDIAIAHHSIQPQYQAAQRDVETWSRVAQTALQQGREDLARAALYRKVAAQKNATNLHQQLEQLVDMQLTLQQNQAFSQSRLGDS